MDRIYQVDECQNVYVARILASGWSGHFYSSSELLHLLPLTWLAGRFQDSGSLYTASRLVMILVFWLNTLLTATACGIPWKDKKFIWVLLGAATLAPLWDYGFEIRHDNLVLLFLLLSWNLLRNPRGPAWFLPFALGALAAIMQFATFKAFIYWVPLGAIVMVVPPLPLRGKRLRVFLLMLLGFLAAGLLVALAFKWSGQLSTFMEGIRMALSFSSDGASRFGPWDTLARLIFQAPLLLGVGVAALVWNFSHFNSERQAPNVWGGVFPETLFLCVALLALLANPAPYPYNLVLLTPFAFILSVRWLVVACEGSTLSPTMTRLAIMVVLFTHMTPFVKSTLRHLDFSNDRQQLLMATAEALTDPARDCVYDASGLVASRKSAGYQWFLHSLIVNRIYEGRLPGLAQMLAQNPAPVVIPSYRFVWLRPEDVSFIQAHYLGLAGDFYVLGGALKGPNPTYECLRAGRYEVSVLAENHVGVRPAVQMDGQALNLPAVLSLPVGNHSFAFQADASLKITWLGPVLKQSPVLPPGDADRVFINWY
ncbi:MAG TPA: hypothetical protein VFF76_04170 [Holophagaceae bacterium]|nr:hypothetical protein [Holophagaceae bacterium]